MNSLTPQQTKPHNIQQPVNLDRLYQAMMSFAGRVAKDADDPGLKQAAQNFQRELRESKVKA